jgi:hypothetical protein
MEVLGAKLSLTGAVEPNASYKVKTEISVRTIPRDDQSVSTPSRLLRKKAGHIW